MPLLKQQSQWRNQSIYSLHHCIVTHRPRSGYHATLYSDAKKSVLKIGRISFLFLFFVAVTNRNAIQVVIG